MAEKPSAMVNALELLKIGSILDAHKDKQFVKRIMDKNSYPVLKNDDGSHSTHSMAWAEVDGRFIVYPTVVGDKKGLKRLEGRAAVENAMKTGEYIEMPNAEDADWLSKRYKRLWEKTE